MTDAKGQGHHITFFRQSGWMMLSTTAAGGMMYAVHMVAKQMPKDEYGLFLTLVQVVGLMAIPALGLQGIFTQQAAASLNPEHERELAGVLRGVLRGTLLLWLVMACVVFVGRQSILESLKITNPAALWVTVLIGLVALWRPLVLGILQGRQNFLWFGWSSILEGMFRFGGVCIIVGLFHAYAAGAISAVFAGYLSVLFIGGWFCRDCFHGSAAPMNWGSWLKRVVPLTLGLGVAAFMMGADMIFVRKYFPEDQTGYYGAAGMIGRALVYFTQPLTWVMFPKLARSAASGESTNALKLTIGTTAVAGGAAALACTLMPSLPLRIVYDPSFLTIATPLVPWFAWCMLPLTLSNVLVNSLMAKSRFNTVPWLLLVAVGYGIALYYRHDTFIQVIQNLGLFSTLLLVLCAWFSFRREPAIATA